MTRCERCLLIWQGRGQQGLLRKHECLGTPTPDIEDVLRYLGAVPDEYGCLIPASPHARPARKGGQHWWLPSAAIRIVGEQYAHRAILRMKLERPLCAGMVAAHECAAPHYENPQCVNPDHLQERTRRQNAMRIHPDRRSEVLGGAGKAERLAAMNRARVGTARNSDAVAKTIAANTGRKRSPEVSMKAWATRRERYGETGTRAKA